MTLFDGFLAEADAVVDVVFGELFDFAPMIAVPDADPTEDPERDTIAGLTAVFDDQGMALMLGGEYGSRRASSAPLISVLARYLPQGVKRLDRFIRQSDGQLYEVTEVNPDGLGRYVLTVVESTISK